MRKTKELVKQQIGTMILPFLPKRADQIANHEFSMSVGNRNLIDSCLRAGLARKMLQEDMTDVMSHYHRNFWAGENGTEFHRHVRDQVVDAYEEHFTFLADEINQLTAANPQLNTVVEIGAGGGSFLDRLMQDVTGIDHVIGNDLSPETIIENRHLYPHIEWVAGDGKSWVADHGTANSIFITFRGVLEYFTQQDLDQYFNNIATQKAPAVLILVEPIAINHDLTRNIESTAYGTEYSFSHNYPFLVRANGFHIRHESFKQFDTHTICTIIATVGLN